MPKFEKKHLIFLVLFVALGLIALQIPAWQLAGSKVKFTLFDFFAPISGGFLGTIPGAIAVGLMTIGNFLIHGAGSLSWVVVARLLTPVVAALYFAKKSRWTLIIPVVAMIVFIANPIGRSVWYYSLFWLIPIAMYFMHDKSLLARSLGATFTAHAVGGAIWIWALHLPASVWQGLIPVVAQERLLMAVGIAASYVVMNNVLNFLVEHKVTALKPLVNHRYVLGLAK